MSIGKNDVELPTELAELIQDLVSKKLSSNQFLKKCEQITLQLKKRLGMDEYTAALNELKQQIEQLKLEQKIAEDIDTPTQLYRLKRDRLNNDPYLFVQIEQIEKFKQNFLTELLTQIQNADEKKIFHTLLLSSVVFGGLTDLVALKAFGQWLSLHLMGSIVLKSAPTCKLRVDSAEQLRQQFEECLFELRELQETWKKEDHYSIMKQRQMLRNYYLQSMCYRQLETLKQQLNQLKIGTLFQQQQEKIQSYITTMRQLSSVQQQQLTLFLQALSKASKLDSFLNKLDQLLFKEQASIQLPILEKRWNDLDTPFWDIWMGYQLFANLQDEIQNNAVVHYPLYYEQQSDERYPCLLLEVEMPNYGVRVGSKVYMPRLWRMDNVSKTLLLYLMRHFARRFAQQDSEDIEKGDYLKFQVNSLDSSVNEYSSYYLNLKSLLQDKFAIMTSLDLIPNNHLDQFFKQIACFEQQSCSLAPEQWQLLKDNYKFNNFSTQPIRIPDTKTQQQTQSSEDDEDTLNQENFEHYFYYENQDQKKCLEIRAKTKFKELLEQYQNYAEVLKLRQNNNKISIVDQGVWHAYYRLVKFFIFKINNAIERKTTVEHFSNERSILLSRWMFICAREKVELRSFNAEDYLDLYHNLIDSAKDEAISDGIQEIKSSKLAINNSVVGKLRKLLIEFHDFQRKEEDFNQYPSRESQSEFFEYELGFRNVSPIDRSQLEKIAIKHVVEARMISPAMMQQLELDLKKKIGLFEGTALDLSLFRLLFIILYRTGLRANELLGLQIKDVIQATPKGPIVFRICRNHSRRLKSKKAKRRIPMSLLLTGLENELLTQYISQRFLHGEDKDFLFIFNGQKVTGDFLNQLFKTWQWNRLGQAPYRLHSFRHTAINQLFLVMHADHDLISGYTDYTLSHSTQIREKLLGIHENVDSISQKKWLILSDLFGHESLATTAENYLHVADLIIMSSLQQQNFTMPKKVYEYLVHDRKSHDEQPILLSSKQLNQQCKFVKFKKTTSLITHLQSVEKKTSPDILCWPYPLEVIGQLSAYEKSLQQGIEASLDPEMQVYWRRAEYIATTAVTNRGSSRLIDNKRKETILPTISSEKDRRNYFLQLNRSLQKKVVTLLEFHDFKEILEVVIFRTRRSEAFIKFYNTEQDQLLIGKFLNIGLYLFGKDVWHLRGFNRQILKLEKIKIDKEIKGLNQYQYFELTFKSLYKQKNIQFQDFRSYMHLWMIMHPNILYKK